MRVIKRLSKRLFKEDKKSKDIPFSDLSAKTRKKIMNNTVRDALDMQLSLVAEYDKKFGN